MPLKGAKDSSVPSLTKIEMLEVDTQLMMTLTRFGGKWKARNHMVETPFQPIIRLFKVYFDGHKTHLPFFVVQWMKQFLTDNDIIKTSSPFNKCSLAWDMRLLRRRLIRPTTIFETIVYIVLHRLINLKLLRDSGFWHLGIKVISVSLRHWGIHPCSKALLTSSQTKH